jgi:hypothetical protein
LCRYGTAALHAMLKVLETMIVCQDRLGTNTRIAWFKNGGVSGKATRLVLYYKCIILARQARDKHIGKPLKTGRVAACAQANHRIIPTTDETVNLGNIWVAGWRALGDKNISPPSPPGSGVVVECNGGLPCFRSSCGMQQWFTKTGSGQHTLARIKQEGISFRFVSFRFTQRYTTRWTQQLSLRLGSTSARLCRWTSVASQASVCAILLSHLYI